MVAVQGSDTQDIPFHRPDIGEREIAAATECLRSGWLSTGPRCAELEQRFAARFGRPSITVNSATSGILLVLAALGIGPGDQVIVPTLTFTSAAMMVRHLGADVVWCDIDGDTLNASAQSITPAVTERTKAVIVTHYGGGPADMRAIEALARDRGIAVIEDAAHAMGAVYKGREVGALDSAATVFSFYATKPVAAGEGGLIVTRDQVLAETCRKLRLHGIVRSAWERQKERRGTWDYDVEAAGYKANMSDLTASIVAVQAERGPSMQARRNQIAAIYRDALAGHPDIRLPAPPPDGVHAWHLYAVRVPAERRDGLIHAMGDHGIQCSVHYKPLHLMTFWRNDTAAAVAGYPVAEQIWPTLISLPIFPGLTDAQADRVTKVLCDLLNRRI